PVDLEKIVKKDKPIPSPIERLMKARWVDDPRHYIYCSAFPGQRVKLSTRSGLISHLPAN
ncbi:MAG TPA: hypothetical protein VGQ51_01670, partial [Puia sp.]|nr:hypothetical protein [Puia sp.]